MNTKFSEELFLTNKTGSMLYHQYAEHLLIIDYHCHLRPIEILENKEFEELGEMWLRGDHYKWRCMRTFGIGELPKTILYPLDGTKIEAWAVLAAGYCEGGTVAKVQLGAPWWFNDQAYGIQRQFEACANLYPISLSVGMLTDSRSFISYPRHELYRRVLCSYLGTLVERGEYFSGEEALAQIIEDICFNNVNAFFGFHVERN